MILGALRHSVDLARGELGEQLCFSAKFGSRCFPRVGVARFNPRGCTHRGPPLAEDVNGSIMESFNVWLSGHALAFHDVPEATYLFRMLDLTEAHNTWLAAGDVTHLRPAAPRRASGDASGDESGDESGGAAD